MYNLNQQVLFIVKRCNCAGGGSTELIGNIIGKIPDQFGYWYQVSTPSGVHYVRECDIIKVYG